LYLLCTIHTNWCMLLLLQTEKGQYHCNDCGICRWAQKKLSPIYKLLSWFLIMYPLNSTRVGGKESFFHCVKCGMLCFNQFEYVILSWMFFHTPQWWFNVFPYKTVVILSWMFLHTQQWNNWSPNYVTCLSQMKNFHAPKLKSADCISIN